MSIVDWRGGYWTTRGYANSQTAKFNLPGADCIHQMNHMNCGSGYYNNTRHTDNSIMIIRAHSFPQAAEFRTEPRNLAVAEEYPCFRGISLNST